MTEFLKRKHKIVLSDYNYQRDIENRLLMAEMTIFEVNVLREIVDGSLKIPIKQLANHLDVSQKELLPVLEKLSKTKLLEYNHETICVDKEMRKYFESEVLKFDDTFEPDMEFLQGLLSKVPIHVLPSWYLISRSSNHIFKSIIDEYLITPKIYQHYLNDLHFDDPIINGIIRDLFSSSDFKIRSRDLMGKYAMTRLQFEEYMLLLEFHFICCLSYNRVNDLWEEVITPFAEWRSFLRFQRDNTPESIKEVENIQKAHQQDFGFIEDISLLLKIAQQQHLAIYSSGDNYTLDLKDSIPILPHLNDTQNPSEYLTRLISRILSLQLAEIREGILEILPQTLEWLNKPLQEQALLLYRHNTMPFREPYSQSDSCYTERDIRKIEKSLKRILNSGWLLFDDFMKGFISAIGNSQPTSLQNKGKRWRYVFPTLSEKDIALVKTIILEKFFESGIVAIGVYAGQRCFCVTPFGRVSLG